MFPFKPVQTRFNRINTPMNTKENVMFTHTLPSNNRMTEDFMQDVKEMESSTVCTAQQKMQGCFKGGQEFQPFVNYFQLNQSQDMLNKQWNDFNIEKKMKNLEKQRKLEDMNMPFNTAPYINMYPTCTSISKPNLVDPKRMNKFQ